MPQQRDNASSLDHEAQCPTLLWLRVLVTWVQHRLLVLISVPFIKGPSIWALTKWLVFPQSVLSSLKVNQHNEPRSKLLRATDTIIYFTLNEMIQPECSLCHVATASCCTSRWTAMVLLRRAHLFPHEDNVAPVAALGVWEGPALPVSDQRLAPCNTNILLRI